MKKIIGVFIKDTHLVEETIEINNSVFGEAIELCNKHNCDLYHAGDVFSERRSQPLLLLSSFRKILYKLKKNNVKMHVIPGNHDKVDQESEISYLDPFETHPNLILYTKPTTVKVADNFAIHFMPYFKEYGSYSTLLDTLVPIKDIFNLCLTHIAVRGVKNNDGTKVENNIETNLFKKFNLTMVGHYHDESWINENIWYFPGSYQANYGENNKKGFTLLYDDGSYEFVKSTFKEYIQIKLDVKNIEGIKAYQNIHKNTEDNVRFVFQGDDAELKHVSKEKFAALGIEVSFNKDSAVPINADDLIKKASDLAFDRDNIFGAFDTFCGIKHIEDNSIGKSYLEKI